MRWWSFFWAFGTAALAIAIMGIDSLPAYLAGGISAFGFQAIDRWPTRVGDQTGVQSDR